MITHIKSKKALFGLLSGIKSNNLEEIRKYCFIKNMHTAYCFRYDCFHLIVIQTVFDTM